MTLKTTDKIILKTLSRSSYDKPVTLAELRHKTRTTDRTVKQSIETLRIVFGIPIVSLRRWGYYLPQNNEEREKGTAVYQKQIKSETETLLAILSADLTTVAHKINKILSED